MKRAAVIVLGFWVATAANSATVIDQSQDTLLTATSSLTGGSMERGQTFTVGTAGVLSAIDIRVFSYWDSNPDLIFSIYETTNGIPNETSVFSLNIAVESLPYMPFDEYQALSHQEQLDLFEWVNVDISSFGLNVEVGEVLAFGFATEGGESGANAEFRVNSGFNSNGSPSPYSEGKSIRRVIDPNDSLYQFWPTWDMSDEVDLGFRTHVSTVVPIPAAFWLFLSAVAALGVKGKYRNR